MEVQYNFVKRKKKVLEWPSPGIFYNINAFIKYIQLIIGWFDTIKKDVQLIGSVKVKEVDRMELRRTHGSMLSKSDWDHLWVGGMWSKVQDRWTFGPPQQLWEAS